LAVKSVDLGGGQGVSCAIHFAFRILLSESNSSASVSFFGTRTDVRSIRVLTTSRISASASVNAVVMISKHRRA
jgi:hypothetical protein